MGPLMTGVAGLEHLTCRGAGAGQVRCGGWPPRLAPSGQPARDATQEAAGSSRPNEKDSLPKRGDCLFGRSGGT